MIAPYDSDLIRRVRRGDEGARNALLERWMPAAARAVGRMRLPPHSLEDLVQEAMLGLLRRLPQFDPERGDFARWLRATIHHAVLDHLRAHGGGVLRLTRRQMRARRAAGLDASTLCVSLEERLATEGDLRVGDVLPCPREPHTAAVERRDLLDLARAAVSERERRVLDLLYPRDGTAPLVMRQAGEVLGISESRVAQLRERAFRKMRWSLAGAAF